MNAGGWASRLSALRREAEEAHALFTTDGRHTARRRLGRGAHGSTYLAIDAEENREVALKRLLSEELAERQERVRDRLEGRRVPSVACPIGVVTHPAPLFTRMYVEGTPLGTYFSEADRGRVYDVFEQVATALVGLHAAGVAHGALHGENVIVDRRGRAVLVDAGLAVATDADDWRALGALFAEHLPHTGVDDPGCPRALCERLLRPEPERRPGAAEVLATLLHRRDPGLSATRYRDLGWLGRGGMGEVRRVEDPVLQRRVALKSIRPDRGARDEGARRRFLDEARITAALQHPGVVPVHELNEMPDGTIYFTMKEVVGRTLGDVVREHHAGLAPEWSLSRLVEVFHRVCETIAYAHAQGMVHRDLHPGNVMLGEYGEVRVLDWGLAFRFRDGEDAAAALEGGRVTPVAGTPGYMPGEQSSGELARVGPHSDVFALGAVLYEILTGRSAFPGATTTQRIAAPMRGDYVPVLGARPDAPPELSAIAEKALSSLPEARYPSALELARDVEAWQRGEPVTAYTYTPMDRLAKRLRPYSGRLVAGLALGLLLTAAALVSFSARQEARRDRAQFLASRAQTALETGDRVQAEAFAAAALVLQDRPEARGVLARVGTGWSPVLDLSARSPCGAGQPAGPAFVALCAARSEREVPDALRARAQEWELPAPVAGSAPCPPHMGTVVRLEDGGVFVVSDAADGAARWTGIPPRPEMEAARCSPDGEWLALAVGKELHLWQRRVDATQAPLFVERLRLTGHVGPVRELAWSDDGALLASAGAGEDLVRVWSVTRGAEVARLPGHADVTRLAFDGPSTLATEAAGVARLWALGDRLGVSVLATRVPVRSLGWRGKDVVSTLDAHGTVRRWSTATGERLALELRDPTAPVVAVAEEPGGARLAAVRTDGALAVYDADLRELWSRPRAAGSVAWSGVGGGLAVGEQDGTVTLLDGAKGLPRRVLSPAGGPAVHGLAWSHGGGRLLARRADGGLDLYDVAAGVRLGETLPRAWGPVALSGDGERVAVAGARGAAIYEVSGGEPVVLDGAEEGLLALAFHPDGVTLATAGKDDTVRFWDAKSGRELARLPARAGGPSAMAFSPDGATLATAGAHGDVALWSVAPVSERDPYELREDVRRRYGAIVEGTTLLFAGGAP